MIAEQDPVMRAQLEAQREREIDRREIAELREWRRQRDMQDAANREEQGLRNVLGALDRGAETYPHAWEEYPTEDEQRDALVRMARRMHHEGEPITIPRILRRLDAHAKLIQDSRVRRAPAKSPNTASQAGHPANSRSSAMRSTNPARTLPNAAVSAPRGQGRKLTEEEQDDIFRAQLKDALRKDREAGNS
jgi:hypothetical protein